MRMSLTVIALVGLVFLVRHFVIAEELVDFSTDVKPIINKKCIICHGGVKAKAGFSLLFRDLALQKTESGKSAIVPGDPKASELIRRINETDPDERMPYKHERLSKEEISTLTRWIKQGAKWGDHWAYTPIKQTVVPKINNEWISNDVDRFIYEKLDEQKLEPSPVADKATLLRRVSLDIIGMYPSTSLAEKYLRSNDDKAYETLVDSLLASPHFGERWASMWLDLARYADSKGYEADHGRDIWKYRDWVISAFNEDKPYDQFLEEQLAGDLIPDPTDAQFIATAFSRNSMTNDEGGTDNEEFRTTAVLDRVNTTWEALMGTTFSCVQCHSHPYDPFRHDEYYNFVAFFNNTRDEDQSPEYPFLRAYNDTLKGQVNKLAAWVKDHGTKEEAEALKLFLRTMQPALYGTNADSIKKGHIDNNNGPLVVGKHGSFRFKNINLSGIDQVIFNYYIEKPGGVLSAHLDSPDGHLIGKLNIPLPKNPKLISYPPTGDNMDIISFPLSGDNRIHDIYFKYVNQIEVPIFFEWFAFNKQLPGKGTDGYEANKKLFWELLSAPVETVPVLVENPVSLQRKTFVFEKGNRLTLGNEVKPRVPNSLAFAMPKNAPPDRRGLVMWMTNKKNPLVSRTLVNRFWEQLFGTGIVETLEDMGTQGSLPTHRELLDHYSWKLMNDYQWSMKKLLKELVMSSTYRQDSKFRKEIEETDPSNRYYAKGPRIRLHAEQIRDQHLCISGMMSDKMYGPGVMPWQPEGIWSTPYNSESWAKSKGENQYRRSVYTFWKRSSGYPSMITFDASPRSVCTPRRIRTNTPLQALVTLNDSVYVDLAGHFASRMARDGGDVNSQIARGFEMMLFTKIPDQKLQSLLKLYRQALVQFKKDKTAAKEFAGESNNDQRPEEKAALKLVANAMLNFDEVITKN